MMIWTVYGDESGTNKQSPIIAMGGFLGPAGHWENFDNGWNLLLKDFDLEYFHAVDLIHRDHDPNSPFKDWDDAKLLNFILRANHLIDIHLSVGFVIVLRKDDYKNYYKSGRRPRKLPQDTDYGVLFRAAVSFVLQAICDDDDLANNSVVNFILENGAAHKGDADRLYKMFKTDRKVEPAIKKMLGPVLGLAEKKESPGCQVSDFILGGAYRQELTEHTVEPSIIEKSSFVRDPQITHHSTPIFRVPITREILESLKESLLLEEEERRNFAQAVLKKSRAKTGQI
jgi:hypothetical protein